MKKTLIASAVAAATLSTSAMAMDPATALAERLDSMPEFYGNIQLVWANETTESTGAPEISSNEFSDNGSTFGIKHEHEISDGVTGFLKAEWEFSGDDKANGGIDSLDEAYIGVKGDFGHVQLGSDDTVYEWVDIMDMYEYTGLEGDLATQKEGDNLQYVSPDLGGVEVGVTLPIDSDSNFGGALAAKFAIDAIEIVASYGLGREEGPVGAELEAGDAFGLAASIGIDDLSLGLQYESRGEDTLNGTDLDNGLDYIGLLAQYGMGANNFALGYQMKSFDASGSEDETGIYVQALHNMSDNMYVYLEYLTRTDVDGVDGDDAQSLAIGAAYSF